MNSLRPDRISPKNSFSSSFWAFLLILIISIGTVFFLRHKPIWYEVEILAAELVLIFGSFYSYALYRGFDYDNEMTFFNPRSLSYDKLVDWCTPESGSFGLFTSWGGEIIPIIGHIIGFLIDVIAASIVTLIISFLLWIGLNFVLTGIVFLVSIFYYLFKRSSSIVFRHQAACKGRILFSLFYGLLYACLYTLLICLMVFLLRSITP